MGAGAGGVAYPKKLAHAVQLVELPKHIRSGPVGLVGQGVAVEKVQTVGECLQHIHPLATLYLLLRLAQATELHPMGTVRRCRLGPRMSATGVQGRQ